MQETWFRIWVRKILGPGSGSSILGQEDPLKEEMATHSSILVRRTPWTEKLAGYSPWGHKELHTAERLSVAEKD